MGRNAWIENRHGIVGRHYFIPSMLLGSLDPMFLSPVDTLSGTVGSHMWGVAQYIPGPKLPWAAFPI